MRASQPQDSPQDELQQQTWELLLQVASDGERHGLNSDLIMPYHTELLRLIQSCTQEGRQSELNESNKWALRANLNDASKHKWFRYYTDRSAELQSATTQEGGVSE